VQLLLLIFSFMCSKTSTLCMVLGEHTFTRCWSRRVAICAVSEGYALRRYIIIRMLILIKSWHGVQDAPQIEGDRWTRSCCTCAAAVKAAPAYAIVVAH
jgi:hypothetical protein